MEDSKERSGHCIWKILLIFGHVVSLVLTLIFNFMSASIGGDRASTNTTNPNPLYKSDTGTISDKYDTGVTPAGWTFTIWSIIYTWQIIHTLYAVSTIFRKNRNEEYLYNASPAHIHYSHYIVYIINNAFNISWIFLFDREQLVLSFVFLFFIALTIYISGFLVCWSLNKAGAMLETSGQVKDIWMTRSLTVNGLAFYGTWCTIATLLNLTIVMVYVGSADMITACWIAFIILTIELLVWFVLETFVFDRYLRYVFSPYIVLIMAFSGVLSKHWKDPVPSYTYYSAVLFGVAGVLAVVKVVVIIVKTIRNPIHYNNVLPEVNHSNEAELKAQDP